MTSWSISGRLAATRHGHVIGWVASLWEFYFKLLQTVGSRFYPQWRTIFYELPQVVRNSTWLPDLIASLRQYGYSEITVERLIVGTAALVTGQKGTA